MKFTVTERRARILQDGRGTRTRAEVWAARSVDGRWEAERLDEPGTPWVLRRTEDGRVVSTGIGSLPAVEACVASGAAERIANRCDACGGEGAVEEEVTKGTWGFGGWTGGERRRTVCACCGGDGRWKATRTMVGVSCT